ncbi:MAG: LysR family transcriptional regulator [Desulfuromonadaceae bacterium]|nr:LysR family transcriptional regulator [Desulfuromonadaceae bacterium]
MTLKQLEVFVSIAETGSFSKGADKSGITQSTASQHIIGLEKELGLRLFDRGRDGALLTEAGKLFYSRAGKILSDCNGSRSAIRRFLGMDGVIVRVGGSDIAGSWAIPLTLSKFQKERPKVQIEVYQGNSRSLLRKLVDEEIELGFISGRFEDDRLSFEQMGEDTLVCAVSPELNAGNKESLSQAQLCKVPFIVREDGSGTQKSVYEALARTWINKDSLAIVARLGSSDAIRRALVNGAGYAFISERVISEDLANGQLMTVRIPGVQITRKYFAVRREGRELSPAAKEFLTLMLHQWR